MNNWNRKRKVVAGILLFFIAAQAIQPPKNNGPALSPAEISQVLEVPDTVLQALKKSCYDCHSNQTTYPWYNKITPVNWWIAYHVEEGKRELNFSTFGQYSARRKAETLKAIAEKVEKDVMPLPSYLVMHRDAELTEREKTDVAGWARRALCDSTVTR
jgi:hypothetical protein